MNNNGNKPVEEEYRSSQIYRTLTGSGSHMADQIARGLDKAAEGIDTALRGVSPVVRGAADGVRSYQQNRAASRDAAQRAAAQNAATTQHAAPQRAAAQSAAAQQPQTTQTNGGTSYTYHYSYPNGQPQRAGQQATGGSPTPAPQIPPIKIVRRGSPVKFYLTGAAAVLYAITLPLYQPAHFIIFGLVLAGVFLLSSRLFRGKKEFVPIELEKPKEEPKKQEEAKPSRTGNPEVDKIIDEGNGYLKKLREANDAIPDEALSEDIARMEKASADIFRFIADHPDKAPQIRKFMNYYLPTTLKLLNTYQRLSSQSVKGENITSTMFNIAGMMHTVADAFEKQLDSLFSDEAMDVSADISVFETLLKQEGFVEEQKTGEQGKP